MSRNPDFMMMHAETTTRTVGILSALKFHSMNEYCLLTPVWRLTNIKEAGAASKVNGRENH
jgi:hypothetical protein